jgi:parallel beta-helix repeat protein
MINRSTMLNSRSISQAGILTLLLAALLALALMLALAGPVYADNPLIVNNTGDGGDANPGDGACETGSGNGICTLRAAIQESNADTATTQTITFNIAGAGPHTLTPGSALPDITHPVIIDGLTQPGASCASWPPTLLIELDGTNVPAQVSIPPINPSGLTPPIGLNLTAGSSTVRGLVINKFDDLAMAGGFDIDEVGVGIVVNTSDNNTIECNFLGTEPDGTTAAPNQVGLSVGNGNSNAITGNLISGNGNGGSQTAGVIIAVEPENGLESTGNQIVNNRIGTDKNGTADLGNAQDGILLVNARNSVISGNLISGNGDDGIDITDVAEISFQGFDFTVACDTPPCATGNVIQNNTIGLDLNGSILANGDSGVQIEDAEQNTVQFNTIAVTGKHGVEVNDQGTPAACTKGASPCAISNTIRANSIYANTNLGIDLTGGTENGSGVTANDGDDSDSGSNMLQNYPVLSSALTSTTSLVVSGVLTAAANSSFTIDLFANDTCDASGHGEGQTFLTSDTVSTNASGRANFVIETTQPGGAHIAATATGPGGNTSEFSECVMVSGEIQGLILTISGGDKQSTLIDTPFAQPLAVLVTNNLDQPVGPGEVISFTAPASGAGLSGPNVVTTTTNSSGLASVTVTVNGTPGSYQVVATAAGSSSPAIFDLTNTLAGGVYLPAVRKD